MVTLNKIYTKAGDGGKTRLGDNSEVEKTDIRVEAYGEVDELNTCLGVALCYVGDDELLSALLKQIQNDLFDLGADLCWPIESVVEGVPRLSVTDAQVLNLEEQIDEFNKSLETLRSFVLPGGSILAGHLHLARAVCRRAERRIWYLGQKEDLNGNIAIYLNRLSDLLFVLARYANDNGKSDVLWVPGGGDAGESDRG
ncbi:MAG: cob(I)yrinic acid a,c-diamide adenosyltransferase [Candidatus Latescibacterota bacterium]|nr:cob(I)yrinic acid a,c-diamide adenosyltransferase [Candidatus Latescibacterota bacterium]